MRKRVLLYLGLATAVASIAAACGGGGGTSQPAATTSAPAAATTAAATTAATSAAATTSETATSTGASTGTQTPAEIKAAFNAPDWSIPVLVTNCDAPDTKKDGCYGTSTPGIYSAIPKAEVTKKWNICVSFPHLKDPYWVAADYGIQEEATRDGAKMSLFEAGGYTNLPTQINQLQDCVAAGAQAIVLGAISYDGLDGLINQWEKQGIVVIDGWNGVNTPEVSGHSLTDFYNTGKAAGEYLSKLADSEGKTLNVVVLPGPPGAGWSERTALGFQDAVKGTKVNILDVKKGDTGKDVQLQLIQNALQAYPNIDWIVGNSVAADAATVALKAAGKSGQIKVLSTYIIPSNLEALKTGDLACAVSDPSVAQARVAFDMAVRRLEGKPEYQDLTKIWAASPAYVYCGSGAGPGQNNLSDILTEAEVAPDGFNPVFNVG